MPNGRSNKSDSSVLQILKYRFYLSTVLFVKNHVIRKKMKVIDVTSKIRRLKWQWAGHMIRGQDK